MGVSRRNLLTGAAAATAVVAFDPTRQSWLGHAAAQGCPGAIRIPRLDGELLFDAASLDVGATDFGHLVERRPAALLKPGSVRDVQRAVRFANRHGISVAMRGQAHSCFGQAQALCGIVIDTRTLDAIHSIDASGAWVDAGVKWSTLTLATLAEGLTPRVLTDYLELSVGGVLSVGGIGGAMNRYGFVADNVEALEVVTGDGCLHTLRHGDLFRSVPGSLGQFALIVRAKVSLDPAPTQARVYDLVYTDLSQFIADQRTVANDERFDFLEGQLIANDSGGFDFLLQAAMWFDAGSEPDDAALLAGLSPVATTTTDQPYFDWLNRVAAAEGFLRSIGLWETPHPWSDLFLDDRSVESYMRWTLDRLSPADLGFGLALLYPFKRRATRARYVATPNSRLVWAFDLLRFPFPDPAVIQALLDQNRELYEEAARLGGKRYPVSALDFDQADWIEQYGPRWRSFASRKRRYDPRNVLTPGQHVFGS
tara:strand:- start:503 stop:1945 length:1443 start_codon:yes stop_codon:yes gene_type:complete